MIPRKSFRMEGTIDTNRDLQAEDAELRSRLAEAEDTLRAIQSGEVEALVIGDQIYTLESADAASNRFRGEVLDQINDAVVSVDPRRRLTYINPAAEKLYGVTSSEVLGLHIHEIRQTLWEDEKGEENALRALVTNGEWRGENVQIKRDGTRFFAETSVSRLSDAPEHEAGMLAVIRDVTERKRDQDALRTAHDELESRVLERTHELAEANKALQQEMRERSVIESQRSDLLQRVVTSQEDERRRIARDIHDKLGQRVTALRLQIESISNELSNEGHGEGRFEMLKRTAMRLDSEVSFLAWELRPAALDDLGLPDAAQAYLEDWSHNYKISSEFNLRGFESDTRLLADVETHLYRIMQEALNNIAKHAHASTVNVLLEKKASGAALIIEDNGVGFDPSNVVRERKARGGLGLLGMRERALLIGGTVEIESAPGAGSTIYVRVPAA